MVFFLLMILLLYGGMNLYAFFKANHIFHFSGATRIILIMALFALILDPIIIKFMERLHWETTARTLAYIGYLWMAFIFLFFFLQIALELTGFVLKLILPSISTEARDVIFFSTACFITLTLLIYGYHDAKNIRVTKLEIPAGQLSLSENRLRIVQISDVHVGLLVRGKRLDDILQRVAQCQPDILVSTGDLLDGELDNVSTEAAKFAKIITKYGKYAVTGNHEYYAGIKKSLDFTQKAGFEILRDEIKHVAGINLVGFNDETDRTSLWRRDKAFFQRLLHPESFTLILKHQPRVDERLNFNLQLSGHTHAGQIFPFRFFTRLFFPRNAGFFYLGPDKHLYVSAGTGTWGPPVRLLAPAEITVIDLVKKQR
jgi:hypothetical protein